MSNAFYCSIIDDEKVKFGIKEKKLKNAASTVSETYSRVSLKVGSTYLDYNDPHNRCAYLYKYASVHTHLVSEYFSRLLQRDIVRYALTTTTTIRICCLGGGPGTDIVGLFKVLARYPEYYGKVVEVTVLDICGGWRNSFVRIMSNLTNGGVENVPSDFVNHDVFEAQLIEANLLKRLPPNIVDVISKADIICFIRFISAVISLPGATESLTFIGDKVKAGAIILYIDNCITSVTRSVENTFSRRGMKTVLGPTYDVFHQKKVLSDKICRLQESYQCFPLFTVSVAVLGLMKWSEELPIFQKYALHDENKDVQSNNIFSYFWLIFFKMLSWISWFTGKEIPLKCNKFDFLSNRNFKINGYYKKHKYRCITKHKNRKSKKRTKK